MDDTLGKIIKKIKAEIERAGDKIPYIPNDDGFYADTGSIYWWTNGFWAGMLWQLYNATGEDLFKNTARISEERLDAALDGFESIDHDAGFLWLLTAGADYRLTANVRSKHRVLHAANVLAGRYNPNIEIIRAWDEQWMKGYDTAGGAIIDTMMNLPLLYLASDITGDDRFKAVAMRHADTMLKHMLRDDGSVNHQVVFDVKTGEVIATPGGQGYESGSSWSRGQAWAIYGFALAYRYTGKIEYLNAAKRTAAYFAANAALTDYVPAVDFCAPKEPLYYDTTAGAAASCGMMEIAEHVGDFEKDLYIDTAKRIINAIDKNYCDYNPANDGIVGGGSVSYHCEKHHEKIIYGDYFFVEAVLRILKKDFLIW